MMLSIGGLRIAPEACADRVLLIPGFAPFVTDGADADVRIVAATGDMPQVGEWLHGFDVADSRCHVRFGRAADGGWLYALGEDDWLYCPTSSDAPFILTPVADLSVLRFALWIVYSMAATQRGRVPIHSSVVICHERAVLCLGESGTGKSTHTQLWLDTFASAHLLNDDCPILALDTDGVHAYGSPWSGKRHVYLPERWPVAALMRLEQRPQNSIVRLSTLQALVALLPSCPPCLMHDDRLQSLLLDYVGQIAAAVPVSRLGCLPNADAARLSHDTIFAK